MPLSPQDEKDFNYYTSHLDQKNIDVHISTAKRLVENGLKFSDKQEAISFLMIYATTVRKIADVPAKFSSELQQRYNIEPAQLKECINIKNKVEKAGSVHGLTFFAKPAHFDKQAFEKLFNQFSNFPQHRKTLK